MRAYQLSKGGAGIEGLVQVERPDPKPAYRQVLVKVTACSLNYRDLAIARGAYRLPVSANLIPLSDGAGEVVEIGAGVRCVKVGDKVAGNFFQRWSAGEPGPDTHQSALGGGIDGMLAEYVVLEEDGVVRIPEHLSLEEGATLPCAGVTAWHAMIEHARLIAGKTVLLQGTGGVSILGLQLAKAMGITAIITSSRDDKLARAKQLGADHGINYKTTADWDKARGGLRGRGRRGRHDREVVCLDPGGRTHQSDREPERPANRTQSRADHRSASQRARHLGWLHGHVRSDEPSNRRQPDQTGNR